MSKISEKVEQIVTPIIESLGLELVEVEFKKQNGEDGLTVYIDKDGGVTLDDCEAVHNAIDGPLDDLDPTNGKPYTLNVSSPGLDRPFKTQRDYKKNLGKEIEISLYKPIEGAAKKFEAVLDAYDMEQQTLSVTYKGKNLQLNIKDIALARAVIKF